MSEKKGGGNLISEPLQYWEAGDSIREEMEFLVANHFPDLALIMEKIAIIMRSKAAKSGGRIIQGRTMKAPTVISVLGKRDWAFIIELAGDVWMDADDQTKKGILTHCLCHFDMTLDKEGNETFRLQKPDVQVFKKEISICGWWHTDEDEDEGEKEGTEAIKNALS